MSSAAARLTRCLPAENGGICRPDETPPAAAHRALLFFRPRPFCVRFYFSLCVLLLLLPRCCEEEQRTAYVREKKNSKKKKTKRKQQQQQLIVCAYFISHHSLKSPNHPQLTHSASPSLYVRSTPSLIGFHADAAATVAKVSFFSFFSYGPDRDAQCESTKCRRCALCVALVSCLV